MVCYGIFWSGQFCDSKTFPRKFFGIGHQTVIDGNEAGVDRIGHGVGGQFTTNPN